MKALIIGNDSNIGKALAIRLRSQNWQMFGTSRRNQPDQLATIYLDLEQTSTFQNIQDNYDVIFALAALPNIALCENNPALSQQINLDSQVALAKHCLNKTTNYIFLSTAAVFDGSKPMVSATATANPRCVYGLHKAMAESELLNLSPNITVVRTSKVITENYKLTNDWINALQQDLEIEPFHDLNLSPVPIHNITELLQKIAEQKTMPILHISGQQDIPYYELAVEIAKALGKSPNLIKAKSYLSAGLTANMTFPFSTLDMSQTTQAYGLQPAGIEKVLNLVVKGQYCVGN